MRARSWIADETGAALIMAILIATLLGAIGAVLITSATTDTALSASARHVQEVTHGAEAGLELALHDLATVADWSAILSAPPSNRESMFVDGATRPIGPDGRALDLADLTVSRQRESDTRDGSDRFGADTPQWRLYLHMPLTDVLTSPRVTFPVYLVVWVADDGTDGDDDPSRDANGVVLVHAEAHGADGSRRAFEATVVKVENRRLRVLTVQAVR
jgi:hypothetical protein